MYAHPVNGSGTLLWDSDKGAEFGVDKVASDSRDSGKVFTYTYSGIGNLFPPSPEAYTLTATVYAGNNIASGTFSREVYIDGSGPAVRIQSVRGAYSDPDPASVTYNSTSDTARNITGDYTVNGNVQFAVNFYDDITLLLYPGGSDTGMGAAPPAHALYPNAGANYPMVKWWVEEIPPADSLSMQSKINNFRASLAKGDLSFFESIDETHASGWARPGQEGAAVMEDRSWNFKFNTRKENSPGTNAWDKQHLYVYVIAQDNARNLGYMLQRIYVDDDKDKPTLDIPELFADISDESGLDVIFGTNHPYNSTGNWNPRRNILEKDQGIALYVTDDDGIGRNEAGVAIWLTDLNGRRDANGQLLQRTQFPAALIEKTLSSGNSKDWRGTLSQAIMAQALYGTARTHLPDGMYKIEITVSDDVNSKVSIARGGGIASLPGDLPASQAAATQTYYFAVFTELPVIALSADTPRENTLVNDTVPQRISVTVKSQLNIKRLSITFTPNVEVAGAPADTLFYSLPANQPMGADYYYTYSWDLDPVNFAPLWLAADSDRRTFRIDAYDRLGNMGSEARTVKVDNVPPRVNRVSFNHNRDGAVYGKVPFTISAYDDSGLYDYTSDPNAPAVNPDPAIRWWLRPADAPPTWDTTVAGGPNGTTTSGQFLRTDAQNGRYSAVFDSMLLEDGDYVLYVIAKDNAGNYSSSVESSFRIVTFAVDQDADYPTIDPNIEPPSGDGPGSVRSQAGLVISGTVADSDLFDADKFAADGTQPYVSIRFPKLPVSSPPVFSDNPWHAVLGELDAMGRISFSFTVGDTPAADIAAYFADPAAQKYYQIRVTDEPVAGNGNYGKNPDGGTAVGAVSRIFPSDATGYTFVLDNGPPAIYFASHDPTEGHPSYSADRPTFQTLDALVAALSGTVLEPNLEYLTFTYGGDTVDLYRRPSTEPPTPAPSSPYAWTLNEAATTLVTSVFNGADQGPQSVTLEARDIADNQVRAGWLFYKDTQGPSIIPGIIVAIETPSLGSLNSASFPANWPLDWPSTDPGAEWRSSSDARWVALRNTYGVANWPSEFKFYVDDAPSVANPKSKLDKIVAELNANHSRIGEPSVVSNARGLAVISGRFQDEYSFLGGTFEYRFDSTGRLDAGGWTSVSLGLSGDQKSATWSIPIPDTFSGVDGLNYLSMRVWDNAGNLSDVYGLQFVLDRENPYFISLLPAFPDHNVSDGFQIMVPPESAAVLSETERVLSASGSSSGSPVARYVLSGAVSDHNLSELVVIISQEAPSGAPNYSLTIAHDVTKTTNQFTNSFTNATVTDTAQRLTVTKQSDSLWHWTLSILEKDIADMVRTNANGGARRFITLNATDKAGRRARAQPIAWDFYLDDEQPEIQYFVPASPPNFSVFDSGAGFELSGIARDATKIRDVQYSIARYDYAAGAWRWYATAGGSWTLNSQPLPATWPSALDYDPTIPALAQGTVSWHINSAASGIPSAAFTEGQYKVDLYVTDWSRGGGNPASTINDATFGSDPAVARSARKFFVDTAEPAIAWDSATDSRQYFKNDSSGRLEFGFTVTDGNTIGSIEAAVFAADGTTPVVPRFSVATPANSSAVTVTPLLTSADPTGLFGRSVVVRPNMTTNLANGAAAQGLDLAGGIPITYTLRLYVRDGAGVEATSLNTKQFTLDNVAPKLPSITPAGGANTIYGGVTLRGNTTDNSSLISRVAFYVANSANGFAAPPADSDGTGAGWYYNTGLMSDNSPYHISDTGGTELMHIEPGTFTWELKIPNTRNFLSAFGEGYVDLWHEVTAADAYYDINGRLPAGEMIGRVNIYFMAMDQAGNTTIKPMEYWVYPEGDRPVVTAINNPNPQTIETERMLNGNIRISGQARDNERIYRVWFRILNDNAGEPGYGQPFTNLQVPTWNSDWSQGTEIQSPVNWSNAMGAHVSGSVPGDGWFEANRGGDNDTTTSWWVYVNRLGELNRVTGTGPSKIKIEVCTQDATWNSAGTEWVYNTSMLSRVNTVTAFVVEGAPVFEDERVVALPLSPYTHPQNMADWGDIFNTSIKGRGAYKVIVKDDAGVSQIRWTPTEYNAGTQSFGPDTNTGATNILDPPSAYNYAARLSEVNAGTRGLALKAEPHPDFILTGNGVTLNPSQTYIIWEWNDGMLNLPGLENAVSSALPNYMRFTVIKVGTTQTLNLGSGKLLRRDNDGNYQWVVTVDVNTGRLAYEMYGNSSAVFSRQYPVYLSASDASRPTALTSTQTALLPLDTSPPFAEYTLNRRPAGLSQAIGGTAGDATPVGGIAKVVLWFSRLEDGSSPRVRRFISWHEQAISVGSDSWPAEPGFQQYNSAADANKWFDELNFGANPIPSGIQKPFIPPENDVGKTGHYALVIDRNNPSIGTWHHGHNFPMGFSAGGLGRVWYVEINSLGLTSGPVTLHYVVIDTAGNARYYDEPLIVMNDAPLISRIQLGTDIRGMSAFSQGGANGFSGNLKWANGDSGNKPLDRIRSQVGGASDNASGITDYIPASALTVDNIIDFNVRNNLMALRMETTGTPHSLKTRTFRLEYVYGATPITDIRQVKAGRVYIVNSDPQHTTASLGGLGATGDGPWDRGYAFLAAVDGRWETEMGPLPSMSLWELNSSRDTGGAPGALAFANDDAATYAAASNNTNAQSAEFAYASGAFSSGATIGSQIIDWAGSEDWPSAAAVVPPQSHSLFILRVYDGVYEDVFSDFALIRVRVNNNDKTRPFAQLYDVNPNTEGQAIYQSEQVSFSPMSIGDNRARGGLWNTSEEYNYRNVVKPGHIEPRSIAYGIAPYSTYRHSLSPREMGGVAGYSGNRDTTGQTVNYNGFFTTDTVSGEIILRGYVEDDQRIDRVDLQFGSDAPIPILESNPGYVAASPGDDETPATTGFLRVPTAQAGRVYYHDTIDVRRHRVEWAYKWDTQTRPANLIVGNTSVRAIAYNKNSSVGYVPDSTVRASAQIDAPGTAHAETGPGYRINNPGFPVGLNKYNRIAFNLRPYITGFRRNLNAFYHDIRSLQGRYPLSREETVVVTGFNLSKNGSSATTASADGSVTLPGATANVTVNTRAPTATEVANYELDSGLHYRYRVLAIPTAATTTTTGPGNNNGVVTLTADTSYHAVNTRVGNVGERPLLNAEGNPTVNGTTYWVQPWNRERSEAIEGSDLWEDFISVHIWESNDTAPSGSSTNNAYFRSRNDNWVVLNPAMSIDQTNGRLYAAYSEGGLASDANTGNVWVSTNYQAGDNTGIMRFIDPIIQSDIYRSPGGGTTGTAAATWVVSSIIGRHGTNQSWTHLGGVWIDGPGGSPMNFNLQNGTVPADIAANTYHGESTWYNASDQTALGARQANPPATDQFMNPHIVTSYGSGNEHIHVSYYDSKDGSIKYRYNQRGSSAGLPSNGNAPTTAAGISAINKAWVNLDGGFDEEDMTAASTTTLTLVQGNNDYRYLRTVHVANNSWVNVGDLIYTFGRRAVSNPDNQMFIYATAAGNISLNYTTAATSGSNYSTRLDNNATVATITTPAANNRIVDYSARNALPMTSRTNAGQHNAIAATYEGYPVIAYYDASNQRLKMAVSNKVNPLANTDWVIRDFVIPADNPVSFGTGEFVSMRIDHGRTDSGTTRNRVHIAALNTVNSQLVYIRGTINPNAVGTGNAIQATGGVLTVDMVRVVDSVGTVGRWSTISLDAAGNPWIAYADEANRGSMDGVKLAYFNSALFTKQLNDPYGQSVTGWETMHVPARYRVENQTLDARENGRLGLENFPTRNVAFTGTAPFWSGAVSYLGNNGSSIRYRIAYYVK